MEQAKDLFGNPVPRKEVKFTRTGKVKRKSAAPQGHAWQPGSGPAGETCGTCKHMVRRHMARTYIKCGLVKEHWTQGSRTDIRARDPACLKWVKKMF